MAASVETGGGWTSSRAGRVALLGILRHRLALPKKALTNKVLLPILGEPYGRMIEEQEISLRWEKAASPFTALREASGVHPVVPRILSLRLPSLEETYGRTPVVP